MAKTKTVQKRVTPWIFKNEEYDNWNDNDATGDFYVDACGSGLEAVIDIPKDAKAIRGIMFKTKPRNLDVFEIVTETESGCGDPLCCPPSDDDVVRAFLKIENRAGRRMVGNTYELPDLVARLASKGFKYLAVEYK